MVRLRLGRFAWELYYTQTKAVLPRQEILRRTGFALGHLGYITALFEYVLTDMVWMRVWASIGCTMIVGYQLVQPKIQWVGTIWNSIYVGINVGQIYLLKKPPPIFSGDEAELYAAVKRHLAPKQLITLLNLGEFRSFTDGFKIFDQSQRNIDNEVFIVTSGVCNVCVDGLCMEQLGPGCIIGERALLSTDESASGTTVVVAGNVRCFCLNGPELRERLERDATLKGAVHGMFAHSLSAKVLSLNMKSEVLQYGAALEVASNLAEDSALHDALASYRQRHRISQEEHERISAEVRRSKLQDTAREDCGGESKFWTRTGGSRDFSTHTLRSGAT